MTPAADMQAGRQSRRFALFFATPVTVLVLSLGAGNVIAQEQTAQPAGEEPSVGPLPGATILPAPYRIELQGSLGGLAIEVQAGDTGADPFVKLKNMDTRNASCSVLFRNGPESRTRRRSVEPGQSALLTGGLQRQINVLRISVNCATG